MNSWWCYERRSLPGKISSGRCGLPPSSSSVRGVRIVPTSGAVIMPFVTIIQSHPSKMKHSEMRLATWRVTTLVVEVQQVYSAFLVSSNKDANDEIMRCSMWEHKLMTSTSSSFTLTSTPAHRPVSNPMSKSSWRGKDMMPSRMTRTRLHPRLNAIRTLTEEISQRAKGNQAGKVRPSLPYQQPSMTTKATLPRWSNIQLPRSEAWSDETIGLWSCWVTTSMKCSLIPVFSSSKMKIFLCFSFIQL